MRWMFAFFLLVSDLARAQPCSTPTDCGIASSAIPDFELLDVNPSSATFGQRLTKSDVLGQVLVIYFSSAT